MKRPTKNRWPTGRFPGFDPSETQSSNTFHIVRSAMRLAGLLLVSASLTLQTRTLRTSREGHCFYKETSYQSWQNILNGIYRHEHWAQDQSHPLQSLCLWRPSGGSIVLSNNTLLGSAGLGMGQFGYGVVHQDCQRDLRHLLILSLEWHFISYTWNFGRKG